MNLQHTFITTSERLHQARQLLDWSQRCPYLSDGVSDVLAEAMLKTFDQLLNGVFQHISELNITGSFDLVNCSDCMLLTVFPEDDDPQEIRIVSVD